MKVRGHIRRDATATAPTPTASSVAALSAVSPQLAGAFDTRGRQARRGVATGRDIIRVLLVDDHTILRQGLRRLLEAAPDIQVVGEAGNGVDAIMAAAQCAPDVVVMDLNMPGGDGVTATLELSQLERPPKVLILTMYTEEERLIPLLQGGASGFLSKDTAERELIEAIRVVASGEVFVRPIVARLLATNARSHTQQSTLEDAHEQFNTLSPRERSVLCRIAEGYSGVEVGRLLGVTPKTVDTYRNRIGEKLGLTHRTDFVRFALRLGLLGAEDSQTATGDPPGTPWRMPC